MIKFTCSLIVAAIITLAGCKERDGRPVDFEGGEIFATSKNFIIPKDLKNEIEKEYVKYMKSLGAPYDIKTDAELLTLLPREFLDIEVYLWAKSEMTIKEPTKFQLPRGGGGIDLKDYIKIRKGSFFVDFAAVRTEKPEEPAIPLKVYFLSQAKKRKIGGESFGSGCDTYLDISKYVNAQKGKGIQVNATDDRYVSTISGIYYFVSFQPEKLYLAAISVEDSRYPDLLCPKNEIK